MMFILITILRSENIYISVNKIYSYSIFNKKIRNFHTFCNKKLNVIVFLCEIAYNIIEEGLLCLHMLN